MKTKFLFTIIIVSLCFSTMHAQEAPTFSVAGTIDTYYRSAKFAPGTSFANDPGFSIGMANVVLSYEGEKHGFVADFVYGPRGADAVFGSTEDSSQIINQLYAYYNFSDSFTVTVGNFNTFLGVNGMCHITLSSNSKRIDDQRQTTHLAHETQKVMRGRWVGV